MNYARSRRKANHDRWIFCSGEPLESGTKSAEAAVKGQLDYDYLLTESRASHNQASPEPWSPDGFHASINFLCPDPSFTHRQVRYNGGRLFGRNRVARREIEIGVHR